MSCLSASGSLDWTLASLDAGPRHGLSRGNGHEQENEGCPTKPHEMKPNLLKETELARWLGWILVSAFSVGSLAGVARGSGPEDPNPPLWLARYNGVGNSHDFARSLTVSPDGSKLFVTGSSPGFDDNTDYATVAYEARSGAELWTALYDGPRKGADIPVSLAVSFDGAKLFVTGYSDGSGGSSGNWDYATIAYDAVSGERLWAAHYEGSGNSADFAMSLAVSPDGSKLFVTGYSLGLDLAYDFATLAYDAGSGEQLWAARFDRGGEKAQAYSLAVSPDGSKVFVAGESGGWGTGDDYATLAYDAPTGALLWTARYDGTGNHDGASSLSVSPDGSRIFVTGGSDASNLAPDYATVAYDATGGAELWVSRYNGPGNWLDGTRSLAVSPDGSRVFVTGPSFGSDRSRDYATVAYNAASGMELWVSRYDEGNFDDEAYYVAVSSDGSKVFVTGESHASLSGNDYATLAYDAANGGRLWTARYDGIGSYDGARSLAVSPDGSKLFVTGYSSGPENYDYVTIAYHHSPVIETTLDARPAIIDAAPGVAVYMNLGATLTETDSRNAVEGATVAFYVESTLVCTDVTDASGLAECGGLSDQVRAAISLGYTAVFEGRLPLLPSNDKGSVLRVAGHDV